MVSGKIGHFALLKAIAILTNDIIKGNDSV